MSKPTGRRGQRQAPSPARGTATPPRAPRPRRTLRPSFVAREVWAAMRRHLGTAVAIVVTATLALVMLGGALLLRAQVDDLKGAWYDTTQVTAYLTHDATLEQRDAVSARLQGHASVAQVWFEDRAMAYENFATQFETSPELVAEVTADQLPESFRIKLTNPELGAEFVTDLTGLAGVRQVVDEHAQLATLFDVLTAFQVAALVLAAIQALAAVVLISNMVRSTIVVRARELEVGRVMGASRAQLGVPFLAEVGLYGLVGTTLSAGLLALGKAELVDKRLSDSGVLAGVIGYVGWEALWGAIPWLLLAGAGLPMLVTALSLRKHLRA